MQTPEPSAEPTYDAPAAAPRPLVPFAGAGERMAWVAGLALALSAFTGWYTGTGEGVDVSILAWNTGVLGKLVLFLGLGVVALVALRRFGVALPAAVPESLLVILLGSAAFVCTLVRAISIPDEFFFAGRGIGLWISLAAALAVIVAGLLEISEEL
ncbi:MAG TPA: hypothetical protein VEY87_04975 [Gaiellaceae bacterium]|nr:hypothetical protein [Gaiellaceae bacterium]